VVVGGGIGGLASAIALRRAGWEVQVLERSDELREVGAGISLWPNALHALDLLGVGDRVRAQGAIEANAGFRDRAGSWLFRTDIRAIEERYGPSVLIRRATLLAALADALPPGTVTLATEVTGIAEQRDHVLVDHRAGTATADLVVAADGIRSRIRAILWPTARGPRYAGYTTWRLVTPVLNVAARADPRSSAGSPRRHPRPRPACATMPRDYYRPPCSCAPSARCSTGGDAAVCPCLLPAEVPRQRCSQGLGSQLERWPATSASTTIAAATALMRRASSGLMPQERASCPMLPGLRSSVPVMVYRSLGECGIRSWDRRELHLSATCSTGLPKSA
jgi:FAD binding domain